MRLRTSSYTMNDMTVTGGWLFADLLLGLLIIFFVAVPKVPPVIPPLPILSVNATQLNYGDRNCGGDIHHPTCKITLSETQNSKGSINWNAASDMSDPQNIVAFTPSQGSLSPGQSVAINIKNFPCQNGSFTLSGVTGTRQVNPVTVKWHCVLPIEKLDTDFQTFSLTVNDVNGLLNDDPAERNDLERQIRSQRILVNKEVGLAIVYGGAPDDNSIPQAQQIALKVYGVLQDLKNKKFVFGRSSFYVPLYTLGPAPNAVSVDVFFFQ